MVGNQGVSGVAHESAIYLDHVSHYKLDHVSHYKFALGKASGNARLTK